MDELPPPPILAPPAGWLGFLGIKSGGKQPGLVQPGLLSAMDMDRFYRAGTRGIIASGTTANANNAVTVWGTVPSGTVWLLDGVAGESGVLGAAANCYAQIIVVDPASNIIRAGPYTSRGLTGEVLLVADNGPFIALPGYRVGVLCTAAAAPTAFSFTWSIAGFQVSA